MSKALLICTALCVWFSMAYAKHSGKGIWERLSINKCEEDGDKFKFDMALMKINETHDGFKGHIILDEDFDDSFGVRLEICTIVDDSCKQSYVTIDDCLIDFFDRHAKGSITDCLKAANVDPPKMPIPKGEYDIESYAFSNEPTISMFGIFNVKAFVLQGDDKVGCLEARMEFKKIEEEGEEEEEK